MNKVSYHLPEKCLQVNVTYTITQTVQEFSDGTSQTDIRCEILEDLLIEETIIASEKTYEFDTDSVKSTFSDIDLALNFDDAGKGILTGVNLSTTPYLGKLLKASVGVVTQIAKVTAGLGPMALTGSPAPVGAPEITTQKFKVQSLVGFTIDEFVLPRPSVEGLDEEHIPKVILKFSGRPDDSDKKPSDPDINAICLKEGVQIDLAVHVENNGLVNHHVALNETMYVPQLGEERWLEMKSRRSWFTKRGTGISIHQDTGRLTKYTIKRENQLSEIITSGTEGIDSFRDTLKELRKEKETGALTAKKDIVELQKQILEAEKKIRELKNGG